MCLEVKGIELEGVFGEAANHYRADACMDKEMTKGLYKKEKERQEKPEKAIIRWWYAAHDLQIRLRLHIFHTDLYVHNVLRPRESFCCRRRVFERKNLQSLSFNTVTSEQSKTYSAFS